MSYLAYRQKMVNTERKNNGKNYVNLLLIQYTKSNINVSCNSKQHTQIL